MAYGRMLEEKVLLITGAGSGIGRAAAAVFSRHGATLVLADRDEAGTAETLETVLRDGGSAAMVAVDIADEEQVAAMLAFTEERYGRLDGAFNNAGIGLPPAPLEHLGVADWHKILDVNLIGTWLCMKYELPLLAATGGAIVNTASLAGLQRNPQRGPYGAAKAGLSNLTMTAAHEFVGRGVRVNAVAPGVILTAPGKALLAKGYDFVKDLGVPMARAGEPEEVAELAAFLLSARAAYITGQTMVIDGGLSMR